MFYVLSVSVWRRIEKCTESIETCFSVV